MMSTWSTSPSAAARLGRASSRPGASGSRARPWWAPSKQHPLEEPHQRHLLCAPIYGVILAILLLSKIGDARGLVRESPGGLELQPVVFCRLFIVREAWAWGSRTSVRWSVGIAGSACALADALRSS